MKRLQNTALVHWREALKPLLGDKPIRLVPITRDGRKDFGVRGETSLGALLSSGLRIRLEVTDRKDPKPRYRYLWRPQGDGWLSPVFRYGLQEAFSG